MGNGKKLQALLRERNVSVTKLAKDTGISQNTLYALIKRDSEINASSMSKIANALDISINELSTILSEDNSCENEIQLETRVLEDDIEQTLENTREIINKLNQLTKEYEQNVYQLSKAKEELDVMRNRKAQTERVIETLEARISVLENDILNRSLELTLIRNRLSGQE